MAASAKRFLVVGGGKMGEAILSGWLACDEGPAGSIGASAVEVVNPGQAKRSRLERDYGIACVADASEVEEAPDVVILAVKPQVMFDVLAVISENPAFAGGADGPLFVSIAAGLTTAALESALPDGAPVVRVMPNMPLSIGSGASGVCGGAAASAAQVDYIASLFGCLGQAVVVGEEDMDAVCAVSGSGPAYVAAMVEALRDAAARHGLDADIAEKLAVQTVLGTARLIAETDATPTEARESICSPGGTTLAALDAMEACGFTRSLTAGVDAAVARSKELAACS